MREGWERTTLGEVANLVKGSSPTLKTKPGPYPLIVTGPEALSSENYQFEGEAVCVPMVSSTGHGHASLKRVHYASGKFAVANIITACVVKDLDLLSTRFLYHYLQHFKDDLIVTRMKGTANVSLSQARLAEVPLVFPPLAEQRRIVDLIGAVDEAIEAADAEAEAAFCMLEDIRDLLVWGDHPRAELAELAEVEGGLVDPTSLDHSGMTHIGVDRIVSTTGEIVGAVSAADDRVTSGKYLHSAGAVIYSKIRPNLRKVAKPDWRGLCSADAYPLKPKAESDSTYLQHLLISRPFTEEAIARSGRTKMPKVNRRELFSIHVPKPDLSIQQEIARVLRPIDEARQAARATADSLRTLRSNLLTVLLSGEHEIPESYDRLLQEA